MSQAGFLFFCGEGERSAFDEGEEVGVAFGGHVGLGDEAERGGVDAVAQTACVGGAVGEDVAQVGAARGRAYFGAVASVGIVVVARDERGVDGGGEGRPPATGVILARGDEEGSAVGDVYVDAGAKFVVVFVDERPLRRAVLRHFPLQGGQAAAQLGFVGACGLTRAAGGHFAKQRRVDVAIAVGIFVEVVLMIEFGGIEIDERPHFYHHRLRVAARHSGRHGLDYGQVGGVGVVDAGAILRAPVVALTVEAGGVDAAEVDVEQLRQPHAGVVVDHFDSLGRAGQTGADHLVGRVGDAAVGIAGYALIDAVDQRKEVGGAPEAPPGEIYRFCHKILFRIYVRL